MRCWLLAAVMALMMMGAARAAPITRPLIEAGSWSTVEQLPAINAAPESCMIVEPEAAVALRSIGHAVDLMMANSHWDLPRGMRGAIRIRIAAETIDFPATADSSNTAIAPVDPSALAALLQAMAQGQSMRVTLFPDMPVTVPLQGFASALPLFRRCAGV